MEHHYFPLIARLSGLLTFTLLLHCSLLAQQTFQKTFGSPLDDLGADVIEISGGYLVAGHSSGAGSADGYLLRLDLQGNVLWQKTYGGSARDVFKFVVEANGGGFVALGETESSGSPERRAWLVKVAANGDIVWQKTLGETGQTATARAICLMPNGYIVSGTTQVGGGAAHSFFTRVNNTGNVIWNRQCSGTASDAYQIEFWDGQWLYAGGSSNDAAGYLLLDPDNGDIVEAHEYDGVSMNSLASVRPSVDGNVMLSDHTFSAVGGSASIRQWVQKVTPDGQVLWSKTFRVPGYQNLRGRIENTAGDGYLLCPGDANDAPGSDAIMIMIDAAGFPMWCNAYGGGQADRFFKAMQAADGGYLAVGYTRSTVGQDADVFLVKTDSDGLVAGCCLQSLTVFTDDFAPDLLHPAFSENNFVAPDDAALAAQDRQWAGESICWAPQPTREETIEFCAGESVVINGVSYNQPGVVSGSIPSGNGCDTLVTYNLEVLLPVAITRVVSFCPGESVTIGGQTYSQPVTFTRLEPTAGPGCDSLVTYNLQYLPRPTRSATVQICPGESVTIGGQTFNSPGTATEIVAATGPGCDTLVTYNIQLAPTPLRTETLRFCPGTSVQIAGTTYSQPGTTTAILPAQTGCDTLAIYTLEFLPQPTRLEALQFCAGESVVIGGATYTQSGTVLQNIPAATGGCDTLVTWVLTASPLPMQQKTIRFCPGETVFVGGTAYTQPALVLDTIASQSGACDTLLQIELDLLQQPERLETVELCPGDSVVIGNTTYYQPDTVLQVVPTTSFGCDTLVTWVLRFVAPAQATSLQLTCPASQTLELMPGETSAPVNFDAPLAASDCPCPNLPISQTQGLASGSDFSAGLHTICYQAADACGNTATCCFSINIEEQTGCDVKEIGCMKYELVSVNRDSSQNWVYRVRVTNHCASGTAFIYIGVPDGLTSLQPLNNSTYTSPGGRQYKVRNPNFSPAYSIRFKSLGDSLNNGESDVFRYVLPPQAGVDYIYMATRLGSAAFYEAYLNTFYCPVGVEPSNRPGPGSGDRLRQSALLRELTLFPNPTDGEVLFVSFAGWAENKARAFILDSRGSVLREMILRADPYPQPIRLPDNLPNGFYFLQVVGEQGGRAMKRFVVQR